MCRGGTGRLPGRSHTGGLRPGSCSPPSPHTAQPSVQLGRRTACLVGFSLSYFSHSPPRNLPCRGFHWTCDPTTSAACHWSTATDGPPRPLIGRRPTASDGSNSSRDIPCTRLRYQGHCCRLAEANHALTRCVECLSSPRDCPVHPWPANNSNEEYLPQCKKSLITPTGSLRIDLPDARLLFFIQVQF